MKTDKIEHCFKMKPYVRKLVSLKRDGLDYRLFFKDEHGNLYGGIMSFKSWLECLKFGLNHINSKQG